MTYTREIIFVPGYDYRDDPEKKKYGQHCPEIMFIVRNGKGAVVFQVSTGWYKMFEAPGGPSCRIAWHLPASANPIDNLKHSQSEPTDCEIIKGKCVGSSCMDHDNKLYDTLRLKPQEEFWLALEKFHSEVTV